MTLRILTCLALMTATIATTPVAADQGPIPAGRFIPVTDLLHLSGQNGRAGLFGQYLAAETSTFARGLPDPVATGLPYGTWNGVLQAPVILGAAADLDGDGSDEAVVLTNTAGAQAPPAPIATLSVLWNPAEDPTDASQAYRFPTTSRQGPNTMMQGLCVADLPGHPGAIVAAASDGWGTFSVAALSVGGRDAASMTVRTIFTADQDSLGIYATNTFDCVDFDGDGTDEIAIGIAGNDGATLYVYRYDQQKGAPVRDQSVPLPTPIDLIGQGSSAVVRIDPLSDREVLLIGGMETNTSTDITLYAYAADTTGAIGSKKIATFGPSVGEPMPIQLVLAPGDVNLDGMDDVAALAVAGDGTRQMIHVLRNLGDGAFAKDVGVATFDVQISAPAPIGLVMGLTDGDTTGTGDQGETLTRFIAASYVIGGSMTQPNGAIFYAEIAADNDGGFDATSTGQAVGFPVINATALIGGDYSGKSLTVGAPNVDVSEMVRPFAIVNQLPFDADLLPEGTTHQISMDVGQSQTLSSNVTIGAASSFSDGFSAGIGLPLLNTLKGKVTDTYGTDFKNVQGSVQTVSTDLSVTSSLYDLIYTSISTHKAYEYPILQGGDTVGTFLVVMPTSIETGILTGAQPGLGYDPRHQTGSLLSYRRGLSNPPPDYPSDDPTRRFPFGIGYLSVGGTNMASDKISMSDSTKTETSVRSTYGVNASAQIGGFIDLSPIKIGLTFDLDSKYSTTNGSSYGVTLSNAQSFGLTYTIPNPSAFDTALVQPYAYWSTEGDYFVVDYSVALQELGTTARNAGGTFYYLYAADSNLSARPEFAYYSNAVNYRVDGSGDTIANATFWNMADNSMSQAQITLYQDAIDDDHKIGSGPSGPVAPADAQTASVPWAAPKAGSTLLAKALYAYDGGRTTAAYAFACYPFTPMNVSARSFGGGTSCPSTPRDLDCSIAPTAPDFETVFAQCAAQACECLSGVGR